MINQSKISTMAGRRLLVAMALALTMLQTCAPAVDAAPQRPPRTAPTAQDGGRGSTGHEDTTPAATAHIAIELTSSFVPAPARSSRRPVSHTASSTPLAIIRPYAWMDSPKMSMLPLDGLGMEAGRPTVRR